MTAYDTTLEDALIAQASKILRTNDRGRYTVPTHGLYPFQWNWDSCLTALGQSHFDEARAWTEIETLVAHQWDDGMVPHIVFHDVDPDYFPGPDVWDTQQPVPTSGITQPPVAGFVIRRLFDRAGNEALAREKAAALVPKIARWHDWFFKNRDPESTGLVAILHPWESGRDNSLDWDAAFARVPTEGVDLRQRRDLQVTNAAHRPTEAHYRRYLWLVQLFRGLAWDNAKLHDASPFRIVDPGFNAILFRSCADLADLAEKLGLTEIAAQNRAFADRGVTALETLWSADRSQYLCLDRTTGTLVDSASVGGLISVFADIPRDRAAAIADRILGFANRVRFVVPSHDPDAADFAPKGYWRGPTWLVVNFLIANGLERAGQTRCAEKVRDDSLALIRETGFSEYYDPETGAPCGGQNFTWSAAMAVEFLRS